MIDLQNPIARPLLYDACASTRAVWVAPVSSFYARMPRMSALKLVLWGLLAVLGSVALAFVVGLVNPQEKVHGL